MQDNMPLGAHLVSQRFRINLPLYTHHGIYLGNDEVIHYAGGSDDPNGDGSKIQLTTFDGFAAGQPVAVVEHPSAKFEGGEVVRRAMGRLGEDSYKVSANNCEHFCNWAIDGVHSSQQVDRGSILATLATTAPGKLGAVVVTSFGTFAGLSGGAAMMKGMAVAGALGVGAVGGIASAGAGLGLLTAAAVNRTLLSDVEGQSEDEADARKIGRSASVAGVAGGTAATVAAISAAGIVPGLSAAGITSGLAAIGSTVGGGMAAGMAIGVAAPAAAAVAVGYGTYKLAQNNETVRDGLIAAGDLASEAVNKGTVTAKAAASVVAPIVKQATVIAGEGAKFGLRSALSAIEKGASKLGKVLDGDKKG